MALAYQRQKQPDQARAWLEKAKPDDNAGWEERLVHERLQAEMCQLRKGND